MHVHSMCIIVVVFGGWVGRTSSFWCAEDLAVSVTGSSGQQTWPDLEFHPPTPSQLYDGQTKKSVFQFHANFKTIFSTCNKNFQRNITGILNSWS